MSLRLYLDDCLNAGLLVTLLRAAGHDVVIPADVGLVGADDPVHLTHATADGRVLMTVDADDFLALDDAGQGHAGILGVYLDNDTTRDMKYPDMVRAIANVEAAGVPIAGEFIALNAWRY